nr:PREDICTED: uncharacterized protein LOC107398237 [Tribolium castaneum]|eukprot:XP_015837108.1 PREDICTED: uncharacterized protein LOC107398237 [Tribolium castaneum]
MTLSYQTSSLPSDWSQARITPIFKKGNKTKKISKKLLWKQLTTLCLRNLSLCTKKNTHCSELTYNKRIFTIVNGGNSVRAIDVFRQYRSLRPKKISHKRLFLNYKNKKCTVQPVGYNTFSNIPQKIAEFLKLPNDIEYTGHSFRRSSATLLANGEQEKLVDEDDSILLPAEDVFELIPPEKTTSNEKNENNNPNISFPLQSEGGA